jgi:hypothetical protein
MPNYPWHSDTGASSAEDAAAAALLAGTELPAECPQGLQPVADVLAALRAGPAAGELAGEAAVLAEFRQRTGMSTRLHRSRRRRRPVLTTLLSAKAAAVAAIAAVSLSGAAAAAYSGSLPAPVQRLAHDLVGAPAAHPSAAARPTASPSPAGPNPTGSAAYGLCNAYAHAKAHGTHKQQAVAFRNLAAAAGGASNVAAFCAAVPHPGSSHSAHPTHHPTGKPTSHPTGKPTSHPTGKPTSHPTGKPTSHPSSHASPHPTPSHPTGKPVS